MKPFKNILVFFFLLFCITACSQSSMNKPNSMNSNIKYNKLIPEEERVIVHKATEAPFTGKYDKFRSKGVYVCRRCGAALYLSDDKFDANCGWPAFDDAIPGAVKRLPDPDGMRTEIECARCGAHLGHVFMDEHFTKKDTRYCVNSVSMDFIPSTDKRYDSIVATLGHSKEHELLSDPVPAPKHHAQTDTAIFAGGCFWGVQYYMGKAKGVISTEVGYIHSNIPHPTYEQVCSGKTRAAEAIRVIFNPSVTSYEAVAKLFFEIHDPTEVNRQGPDIGLQYRSEVFYLDDEQKAIADKLINILKAKGYKVATKLTKADTFWKAEDYHQNYYDNNGHQPYCHKYTKRF